MNISLHPLAGGSPRFLCSRIRSYGVEKDYWPQLAMAFPMTLLGEPGRFFIKHFYRKRLESSILPKAPVFILGHWRSGTTYLHHLMSLDPNFCYVSSYHAWLPELFIVNDWLGRNIVRLSMPNKRPMDNIELSLEKPEEEEFPLATTSFYSYIDSFYFPKNTREIFDKAVLFKGMSEKEYEQWKLDYLKILKFSFLSMPGHQLLLKSPANTARIRTILELFPDAKFVHIYRNPYIVFASKLHTLRQMTQRYGLQSVSEDALVENVFWIYRELMNRFFEDQNLIPSENLIEIRYEKFEKNPLEGLRMIYEKFDLGNFEDVQDKFAQHINTQKKYLKNPYHLDSCAIERIYQTCSFTIDKWGYEAPL